MLDKIITVFQGFFSRAFWLGSFLPVAIITASHLAIAWSQYPKVVRLDEWVLAKFDSLTLFPAVFAGLVVLAYCLTPLIPLLRQVLDGTLLPQWMHDELRREHVISMRKARDQIVNAMEIAVGYDHLINREVPRLQDERAAGMNGNAITNPDLIVTAENSIKPLEKEIESGATPALTEIQAPIDALAAALHVNSSRLTGEPFADRLAAAHKLLLKLLRDAQSEAKHRFETTVARNRTLLTVTNPQATRMADARRLIESYSFNVYQVDYDYIWPRLQLVLPEKSAADGQGSFSDLLLSARSQVDFAILSLALVITIPAVWLPVLAFTATSPWLFLTIGLGAPFLTGFFYELAVESQIAFGEVVKTAIDKYRLDLLVKVLRQPLPATLSAERELWSGLRRAEDAANRFDLVYRHPTDTAKSAS
jgi:hypothetical protein